MKMNLKSMSIDALITLKGRIDAALGSRVSEERRELESKLARLSHVEANGSRSRVMTGRGGPRGKVAPKYRNPENPSETWAGRGLKPRWLAAAIKSGKKLDDFSIAGAVGSAKPVKRRGRPRKK